MKRPVGCPLFLHRNGQWAKKVCGKAHYFGTDLDAALKRWADEKDDLLAGRTPKRNDHRPTIVELANLYADHCRKRIAIDDLEQRSYDEARKSIQRAIDVLGESCRPDDLRPLDFSELKLRLFEPVKRTAEVRGGVKGPQVKKRSPTTVAGDVRRIRAFLNWCSDSAKATPPMQWGKEFQPITAKQSRKARLPRKLIEPSDLRAIIDGASVGLKPIILLAINGAMGSKDIANIAFQDCPKLEKWTLVSGFRGKTFAKRAFVMWPETVDAIKAWLQVRNDPLETGLLFHTKLGQQWVRDTTDSVSSAFNQTCKDAKVSGHAFYDLRRTFQTIGQQTLDFPAVSHCMGHVIDENDMQGRYTVDIDSKRIEAVCKHVWQWLYSKKKT